MPSWCRNSRHIEHQPGQLMGIIELKGQFGCEHLSDSELCGRKFLSVFFSSDQGFYIQFLALAHQPLEIRPPIVGMIGEKEGLHDSDSSLAQCRQELGWVANSSEGDNSHTAQDLQR